MKHHAFGAKSNTELASIKPQLAAVVRRALEISPIDLTVIEGRRTIERQRELYAQGRTTPGKIVAWTMDSKHLTGDAVDVAPVVNGVTPWKDTKAFITVGKAMFTAAQELGVRIRWGYDWDQDGNIQERGEYDGPHFELI